MTTYVMRNGELVLKQDAPPLESRVHIISDTMAPTVHHADGRLYDSKAKFRATTKAHGCIEIGNETIKRREPVKLDRGQRREHIRQALYQLRNG